MSESDDSAILAQVRTEQIRTLYAQSVPVLLANVVNAIIITFVLWGHTSRTLLLSWSGGVTLMALARIALRKRYWARERTAAEQEVWGTRGAFGSFAAGSLWGFAGGVLMPESLALQLVLLLVVAGMAAGAAASIACFKRAYYAFIIPLLLPPALRLFMIGGAEQLAMLGMLLMFFGALLLIARNVHGALTQAFRLRFEKDELLVQVSRAKASLVEANAELETRVRQRTQELHASQQQLSEIVNESPDGIVVLDEMGRILSVNPATERLLGRPANALIGKHFAAIGVLQAADATRAVEMFAALQNGEERVPEEYRLLQADGESVLVEVKLRVVRGLSGEKRVHSVLRDVTERERLSRLKQAYESRVRESERIESLGMLAGGIAHDFNNMLTMIMANVDLLDTGALDPKLANARLNEIRHGSSQAANLTKQLLAFSRQQVLDVKPTDLNRVVQQARKMFERALGEPNKLSIALPAEPMVVLVDATQFEQAIVNLLINARHAMPHGGTVELEVQRITLNGSSDWPDTERGPYVRIAVSDSGTGMDEVTRRRVFDPFFTTKELGRGTGLGLSSVHGLVKQAGGDIRVTSEPGRGSRFEIILPCHAAQVAESTREVERVWSPGHGVVLLVEDQLVVRRSLEQILVDAGYTVLTAQDGLQAVELARKREGRIDLLISDVIMPALSGIELSRKLLQMYPQLGVLLVSGYAGSEITLVAELGDQVHFLQKPFDAATLTSTVQTVLQKARAAARALSAVNLTN